MANFRTHLTVAAIVSMALATTGMHAEIFEFTTAILCVIAGMIGGVLPDIDLDHSISAKHGFLIGSLITSTLIVILHVNANHSNNLAANSLMLWICSFVIIRYLLLESFSRLTVHRGIVHSVPYMAIFALLLIHGLFFGMNLTALTSWMIGAFLFVGSMVHLLLDEIYSVNVLNLRLKKSFGTAFKFFEFSKPLQYVALYGLIGVLFIYAPPHQEFWQNLKRLIS
ncbi:metal-dependent hydrolase [Moraxella sp. Tifton1]|uniref:metal-dependent hydrolase n=1 Tax=Moraxella oculi TaxID=2940516 RepID=UPI0020120701|nr:metal-dependent hydrolase [Moraxella sp. Tifton1]MCL1623447.1 metal-dependent hydrolase [Moraxella sp. Tifton1]